MQVGAKQQIAGVSGSVTGRERASAMAQPSSHAAFAATVATPPAFAASFFSLSSQRPQMRGWARKAPEFINSGPPALLNNPCCSRRIDVDPFLKHAMEVHYG
jgi:hypothetical protein